MKAADLSDDTVQGAPKLPPDMLALRTRLRQIDRLSPIAIMLLAALLAIVVAGALWMALGSHVRGPILGSIEPNDTTPSELPDSMKTAPARYDEVPYLGPLSPSDRGEDSVVQRDAGPELAQDLSAPVAATAAADQPGAEDDRSALQSGVMLKLQASTGENDTGALHLSAAAAVGADQARAGKKALADNDESDGRLRRPGDRPAALLAAGTVISASLITGLNSDLPGIVLAQVTEHVRDTATGTQILIPQGARLVGRSERVTGFAQQRVMVAWQRIVLPDARTIEIDDLVASDTSGMAGLADDVDRHFDMLVQGVALSSILGIGTELAMDGEGAVLRAVREATQQGAARAGDQLVARNLEIAPTIKVRPGWPLRAIVTRELVLRPWEGN
ncbi:TrbI/VirB10 family protein [Sphingomonas sp. LaA6.9]|uniref:TrbI/VirB10 family protein n=1 Tax=Sphingomonas sp. LaA6.9 TaxID=2919914 RepID=UPI001F5019B0|nr:TrbI/VirB10 family protein [Sphingomonas sp. LaA6.9]MCJ8158892.1 TrbI/VirB10 family protein [Sphingomonas sp. LaA6.9]